MSLIAKVIMTFSILIGLAFYIGVILSATSLKNKENKPPETETPEKPNKINSNSSLITNVTKVHTLPGDYSTIVGIGTLKYRPGYLISVHNTIINVSSITGVSKVGVVKIWDLNDGSIFDSFSVVGKTFASFCVATDDSLVIGDGSGSVIYVYTPFGKYYTGNDKIITANTNRSECIIQLGDEDNRFAMGNVDGNIAILDFKANQLIRQLKGHSNKVISLMQFSNGWLASGGGDKLIIIWDWKQGSRIKTITAVNDYSAFYQVNALVLLPNGQLVSGSDDRLIKVWENSTWTHKATYKADHAVKALWVLADGNVASGDNQGNIAIWSMTEGKRIMTISSVNSSRSYHHCGIAWLIQTSNGLLASALSCHSNEIDIWLGNNSSSLDTTGSLIHSWPLNSNFVDSISGASLTNFGNISFKTEANNAAVTLSSAYLQFPPKVYFNQDFTFSIWVKFNKIEPESSILDCGVNNDRLLLFIDSDLKVHFKPTTSSQYYGNSLVSVQVIDENVWYHLTITLKGLMSTLYINGVVSGWVKMIGPRELIRTHCYIGKSNQETYPQRISASFSKMQIHSRALGLSEVRQECNCSNIAEPSQIGCYPFESNPTFRIIDGLLHYWPFCGDFRDIIGGANGFGGINASFTSDRFGIASSALDLSNGYIQLPPGIYIGRDYTVTAWVKIRAFNYNSRIIDFGNGGTNDNVFMALSQATSGHFLQLFSVEQTTNLWLWSGKPSPLNTWLHVAFVFSNLTGYIYVNGSLSSQKIVDTQPRSILRAQNLIGKSSFTTDNLANAIIDELKIFKRGLSLAEVKFDMNNQKYMNLNSNSQLSSIAIATKAPAIINPCNRSLNLNYTADRNLINYWAFCANYNDSVGQAHGFGGLKASLTSDRMGVAASALDLSNGFIKIPPGIYFSGSEYTVTAWLYIRAFNSNSRLIEFGNGPFSDNVLMALTQGTSGRLYQEFYVESTRRCVMNSLVGMNLNTWFHVAYVLSHQSAFIYVNGEMSTGSAWSQPRNIQRALNFIGKSNNPEDQLANAIIDELKIFNRGLSQADVRHDMNNNKYL